MLKNQYWIRLHREIIESEIWLKPPIYLKVWIFFLTQAEYSVDSPLRRGQMILSIDEIREAVSWREGFTKKVPSRKQIWGILDWMRQPRGENPAGNAAGNEKGPRLVTGQVTGGLLIYLCNYGKYNPLRKKAGNAAGNGKPRPPVTGQVPPNIDSLKEVKEEINLYSREEDINSEAHEQATACYYGSGNRGVACKEDKIYCDCCPGKMGERMAQALKEKFK